MSSRLRRFGLGAAAAAAAALASVAIAASQGQDDASPSEGGPPQFPAVSGPAAAVAERFAVLRRARIPTDALPENVAAFAARSDARGRTVLGLNVAASR